MSALGKLRYKIRRAGEASPGVILQKIWGRAKPFAVWPLYTAGGQAVVALRSPEVQRFRQAVTDYGRGVAERLARSSALDPAFCERALQRAEVALGGSYPCLGFGHARFPNGRSWQSDPFHKYSWPFRYFASIDYVAPEIRADVKIPWEISRLQYLLWLAEGFIFDPDHAERYRQAFERIARDWIESNPPAIGVNWTCPMEVGIRAINLSIAFAVFAPSLDEGLSQSVIQSLDAHSRFIAQFPELSDVPGNHYLADLAGEVFCQAFVSRRGRAGFDAAVTAFLGEAERQFEQGGCHLERAPVYHRLCLDMVACVVALAAAFASHDLEPLRAVLKRGLDFCLAVGSSSQKLPVIGDCDSGQILLLQGDARYFGGLLQFAAALDGAPVHVESDLAHWLLAMSGHAPSQAVQSTSPQAPGTADRCGFLSARQGDLVAVMRAGEQGLKGRASHDHDDALSIWISKAERDLIVEAGCHSYTLDPTLRDAYIGSRAHNVVQRRGADRYAGAMGSVFRTMRGAPTAQSWRAETDGSLARLTASLAVPRRPSQPFRGCARTLTLSVVDEVAVEDCWAWAEGRHEAELNWHFGPQLRPELSPDGIEVLDERGDTAMRVTFTADCPFELAPFEFSFSPVYGASQPCWGVRVLFSSHANCKATTNFSVKLQG